ncbi:hypothetical protein QVD17_38561 [Tagetes erecta]|uniref:GTD-binding domain-containing protein n=1 Tax=Tagetes erecta TaxID=13708 RepID=A0AAD8NGC4_TARER|nr:hypothetical protein QVD17_38561 [Tagetes erecta]
MGEGSLKHLHIHSYALLLPPTLILNTLPPRSTPCPNPLKIEHPSDPRPCTRHRLPAPTPPAPTPFCSDTLLLRRPELEEEEEEEERNVSAVAINQAMSMITRLQEEKGALYTKALQSLRMMEEQAEYGFNMTA